MTWIAPRQLISDYLKSAPSSSSTANGKAFIYLICRSEGLPLKTAETIWNELGTTGGKRPANIERFAGFSVKNQLAKYLPF
jgi:hypothetical protein